MKKMVYLVAAMMLMVAPAFAQNAQAVLMEVNGTEWNITLTPASEGAGNKTLQDSLVFVDKQFSSENLDKQGFEPTNYTLVLKDDGSTVFDTMQTKGDDRAFWHGVIVNQQLSGVYSYHTAEGAAKDYTFTGQLVTGQLLPKQPDPVVDQSEPAQ